MFALESGFGPDNGVSNQGGRLFGRQAYVGLATQPALSKTLAALLAAAGEVDTCLVLRFDRQRSAEPVENFVGGTLVGHLGMRTLVVGENFACGRGRKGNVDYLRTLGAQWRFDVDPVALRAPAESGAGNHCSSSETRRLIQLGEVSAAK